MGGLLSYNEPMRSLRGKPRYGIRPLTGCLFAATAIAVGVAQMGGQVPSVPPPAPMDGGRFPTAPGPGPNDDPALRRAMEEAAKKRNIERQSKMIADSDRICALAQELMDEINKSGSSPLPVASVKKTDEIQKLAKSVKERMRSE
jgi:hypothetical protein